MNDTNPSSGSCLIERGDVFWVDFGFGHGHELRGIHPAIFVSPERYGRDSRNSLLRFIPLTTQRRDPRDDEMVVFPPEGGLRWPSIARVVQTRPVDRSRILGFLGQIGKETMSAMSQLILRTNGIDPTTLGDLGCRAR